ncbi:hypothetical protein GIB67_026027 [Kingdonia uniflora]|uniref:Protein kinase domain-containing protein n=1 Tax=Kingdonia uniflora TaxID=39325 RepID=A0A7J7M2S4_9MAGN|nr:hypothetical protein GIB67_026027 [Kingdonia uniflora]
MGSLQTPSLRSLPLLVAFLIVFCTYVSAQDDPPEGFHGMERDALYTLTSNFNHPYLKHNWTGIQCYLDKDPNWYGIECSEGRVTGISLKNMGLTGEIDVQALRNLTKLSSLNFKNNSIYGNIMDFSANVNMTNIDLSMNNFDGTISESLLLLTILESLQLQGNILTATVPGFKQQGLRVFNVSNNRLSGRIPKTEVLQSFSYSSFLGNLNLCGSPSPIPCPKRKFFRGPILIPIFVVLYVIGLSVIVLMSVLYYRKNKKYKNMKEMIISDLEKKKTRSTIETNDAAEERERLVFMDEGGETFQLSDLLKASAEGLTKGNFGNVYKAMLAEGPQIVVKRLRDLKPLSSDEFAKQIQVFANMKHPNLLPLLAYYYSKNEKFLVYKYAQNGNLFDRIHGGRGKNNNRIPLKWSSRLIIAQGVARAMVYLHHNVKSQSNNPHGNLKSTNVLLDQNELPLVADYGLPMLIAHSIAVQRMTSYKCPEYQNRGKVTKKSDVWSYGCLLLELLTGKIASHSAPQGVNGVDLCNWVHRAVREEWTAEIFDLEISVQRSAADGMLRLLQIAIRCCDKSFEKRPEMDDVVREVENISAIDSEDDEEFSFDRSFIEGSSSTTSSAIIRGDKPNWLID